MRAACGLQSGSVCRVEGSGFIWKLLVEGLQRARTSGKKPKSRSITTYALEVGMENCRKGHYSTYFWGSGKVIRGSGPSVPYALGKLRRLNLVFLVSQGNAPCAYVSTYSGVYIPIAT